MNMTMIKERKSIIHDITEYDKPIVSMFWMKSINTINTICFGYPKIRTVKNAIITSSINYIQGVFKNEY